MSTLDKILNRAKRGSVDDDDTNYVTVVDRPPSTYSYQKKKIPSRYTNDFERIYQVVKSSYNCGEKPSYIYEACKYDNLVQNYVQKGVADVSSMRGYSNVSLQDLPLACNIPSVVYNTCSPPTNMLIEHEITGTTAGFRINFKGRYLQVNSKMDGLVLLRENENGFTLENTRFIVENNKLKNFITNKFVSYNTTTKTLELVSQTDWKLRNDFLNFNFTDIKLINANLDSGVIYDNCIIEKYTNRLQSYVTSISSVNIMLNQNLDVVSDNFDTVIVYGGFNEFRYLGYNVVNRLYLNQNFNTYSQIYLPGSSPQISLIRCSSNGNWIGISYTDSVYNGDSRFMLLNKDNINQSLYAKNFGTNVDNITRIKDFAISDDGNITYILINIPSTSKYEIYQIYSKRIINNIYTIDEYSSLDIRMKISFSGKNIIIYKEYNMYIYLSLDYGKTFNKLSFEKEVVSAYCFNDEIYFSYKSGLSQIINNESIPIISSSNSGDFILISITNKYFIFGILNNGKIDVFVTDKQRAFNMYLLTENNWINIRSLYVNNTCSRYVKVDANTQSLSTYNLNIPSIYQDTPYILKNGPCYPSYSFTTSTILNEGVKNVFNDGTFVLSSDTTIIKKISNNLSITSSSILRNNISLQIPSISGSIRDIACSNNGQVIIAAVYNGKLLVSTSGSSFTEYNETGQFKDVSKNSITNITRYWTSVACSFSGKYMSACAYNGNIFISTNSGTLFTSSSENFAKRWVQIVMSKSSDDTKDGIIQLACAEDGLFISYDRGVNWSQIRDKVIDNALNKNGLKWSSVAISDSGRYMLATVYGGNVYVSYNYGYNWTIYGVSRRDCCEPVVFPTTTISYPASGSISYLDYNITSSTTLFGTDIRYAFNDNSSLWWSPNINNSSVQITLPYKFILNEVNIVNLTSVDVKITVEGYNGIDWISIGTNINLYSTVNTKNISYSSFRLTFSSRNPTFSTSDIKIQRIKLIGKTDIVDAGIMSAIGNWSSCAIISETQHYAATDSDNNSGANAGLYMASITLNSQLIWNKDSINPIIGGSINYGRDNYYVCRAKYNNLWLPGSYLVSNKKCYFSYNGARETMIDYELASSLEPLLYWDIDNQNYIYNQTYIWKNKNDTNIIKVIGGISEDGTTQNICRINTDGNWVIGRETNNSICSVNYLGTQYINTNNYQLLSQ